MKPKVFRDDFRFALFFGVLLGVLGIASGIWLVLVPILEKWDDLPGQIAMTITGAAMSIGSVFITFHPQLYDRVMGRLLVYSDRIVFKCFLKKTRIMFFEECHYIGTDDYRLLNPGFPVIRGDEISFIYFSENPYPKKYRGKITLLKCQKGFIKFWFSLELAEALLGVLPQGKALQIKYFYDKIKMRDRILRERKKRERERGRKRKK